MTPDAMLTAAQARQPISAHALVSEPIGEQGYLIRHAGLPVLVWVHEDARWYVDTWAMERHEVLNFLALGLHHAGHSVMGVARIREAEEPEQQQGSEPSEPNTSEMAPRSALVTGTQPQEI